MERIMIVSSNQKFAVTISELITSVFSPQITVQKSENEARRFFSQTEYDLVIINTPLSDEFGHDLAVQIAQESMAGVMLLVSAELSDDISVKVEDYGVYVVPKPFNRMLFFTALKLLRASRRRMLNLREENQNLRKKLIDVKLVSRAKCLMVERKGMTERQAHIYLEQTAMQRRITKRQLAEEIIGQYEE